MFSGPCRQNRTGPWMLNHFSPSFRIRFAFRIQGGGWLIKWSSALAIRMTYFSYPNNYSLGYKKIKNWIWIPLAGRSGISIIKFKFIRAFTHLWDWAVRVFTIPSTCTTSGNEKFIIYYHKWATWTYFVYASSVNSILCAGTFRPRGDYGRSKFHPDGPVQR